MGSGRVEAAMASQDRDTDRLFAESESTAGGGSGTSERPA
jgi:hypothetical protein